MACEDIYNNALRQGGMQCWWCSLNCEKNTTIPAPTLPGRPWAMFGFFCCVGCANAYMRDIKLPVLNLKNMLKHECGIPFSVCLPLSPPWQRLTKFGPPWGTMTPSQFHTAAWSDLEFPVRVSRRSIYERQAVVGDIGSSYDNKRGSVTISTRQRVHTTSTHDERPKTTHTAAPRLQRKRKRHANSILSYMQPTADGGDEHTVDKS